MEDNAKSQGLYSILDKKQVSELMKKLKSKCYSDKFDTDEKKDAKVKEIENWGNDELAKNNKEKKGV